MTGLSVEIDGVDYAATKVRLRATGDQGITGLSQAADGTMAEGGVVLDDPDSDIDIIGWQTAVVEDDRCTAAPRLFTGYTGHRTYTKGKYRSVIGREIDVTLLDANVLLQMHRINGADSLRPEETDTERLAWLLSTNYIPLVSDLGLVNGADRVFEATQYKGQFPSDVLNDLVGPRGQIYFVYWDQTAEALGLFYDAPDATTFTSTLSISDVPGDFDDIDDPSATCFYPYQDASSLIDPSEVYSNIRYVYKGGAVYRTNLATATTFFPLPIGHRDTMVENDRVGKTSTAITFADRILARDSVEAQSIDLTVKLPATKVGLIQAGMRLSVRLAFVPGFDVFTWTRIETLTYLQTEARRDYYDVTLHLSTHGIAGGGGTGGGSTQPFPPSAGTPGTLVQWDNNDPLTGNDGILPSDPTDGNLLVMWLTERATGTYPGTPSGWTSQGTAKNLSVFGDQYYARLVTKVASGDTATSVANDWSALTSCTVTITEWSGVTFGSLVSQSDLNTTAFTAGGAITPAAANAVVCGAGVQYTFISGATTPSAGVTELSDFPHSGSNFSWNWFGYTTVTTPVSTIVGGTIVTTDASRAEWGGVTFTLLPSSSTEPPTSGQPIINEFIANGDGTTVTFTTANAYAPGSLVVRVDGVQIVLGLVETDPEAGTFTLDFAPLGAIGDSPAEAVYVDYIAA